MIPRIEWNREAILAQLEDRRRTAENRYIKHLAEGSLEVAAEVLTEMELIELHLNKVEEL